MRRTRLALFLTALSIGSWSTVQAQAGKKAPKTPPPPPPPLHTLSETPPPEPSRPPMPHPTGDGLDFAEGRYGFSFGFPDGGTVLGNGYVGARYFASRNNSVGLYLLLGSDSSAETSSFGLAGKYQSYFAQRDRVHLFWFGQLSLGQNGGTANKGKDDMLFGLAGGAGLEFALLKDFSFSAEGGFGYNTLPDSKSAYATGTGKLAVNFYY